MKKRKIFKFIMLITAVFLLFPEASNAQLADSPWPTFHANSKHAGVGKYPTNIKTPFLKWKFNAQNAIETSPAIGEDGTIYFGTFKNNFFALNPDGREKWRFAREGEEFRSAPSIGKDGTIYFASLYDLRPVYNILHKRNMEYGKPRLYALDPDGTLKWEFEIGGIFAGTINSPLIGQDGTIYIGAGSNNMTKDARGGYRFVAVRPDGTEKWSFDLSKAVGSTDVNPRDTSIYSSAVQADDGTVIFGCAVGMVFALNPDGTEKWRFVKSDGMFDSTPAIGNDGTIYISSTNKNLYAISAEGKEKWHFRVDDFFETNPSIGQDGTIYFGILDKGAKDTHLYALNPDGTLKWKFKTDGGVYSTPAIDSNGIIYFGSYDQHVYSLNPDGSLRWKFRLGGPIVVSPSIDREGVLYFGAWDSHLYAIDGVEREIIEIGGNEFKKREPKEPCGNNICDKGEEIDCRDDCGLQTVCGDGICDQQESDCQDDCGSDNFFDGENNDSYRNAEKTGLSSKDGTLLLLAIVVILPLAIIGIFIFRRKVLKR